ncbi:MAG TPA: ABC transporter permease [Phenylobacterium sp.]|jgi:ABC-2 type transport system permease protein|uniref:ABC transporter permease n=1 Tax=Phenylobacterium sp. TaxID=1871053 RepID=UPI002D407020|nr:ABC transporter permease [Phenylobacterium sp.]HZZ69351.1 ABC transporter permease [Phenylobacterium sp.]
MKDMALAETVIPPQPRDYPGVNWEGLKTLYVREIRRFMKVGTQTLAAPVVTALLYMLVFVVAVGGGRNVGGIAYGAFVAPGLVMMQILSNAFANSSSSLLQAKFNGLMGDFVTPPLSPFELLVGFGAGAATRGLAVGAVSLVAIIWFAHPPFAQPWAIAFFGVGAALIMGFIGIMAGLWAEKFDHMAAVTNFVIMPMTFLSGTFYLIEKLPEPFRSFSKFNPFFYLIDGFRYGFIGKAEGSLAIGAGMTVALTLFLGWGCYRMFQVGYKIKT